MSHYPKTLRVQISAHYNRQADRVLEELRQAGLNLPPRGDRNLVYEVGCPKPDISNFAEEDHRPEGWDLSTATDGPLIHYFFDEVVLTESEKVYSETLYSGIGERCSRNLIVADKDGDIIGSDDPVMWEFSVFVDVSELSDDGPVRPSEEELVEYGLNLLQKGFTIENLPSVINPRVRKIIKEKSRESTNH